PAPGLCFRGGNLGFRGVFAGFTESRPELSALRTGFSVSAAGAALRRTRREGDLLGSEGEECRGGDRVGWEAGTRTPVVRSRAACPTMERPPSRTSEEGSGNPAPGSTLGDWSRGSRDGRFLQEFQEVREVPSHRLAAHHLHQVEERGASREAREGHAGGV